MKNFYLLILMSILFSSATKAQDFTRAIGIRGGISSGFEYRAFYNDQISYRALLSTRHQGVQLTGLKEFHEFELFDFSRELVFVYGFGAHVGYEKWEAYNPYQTNNNGNYYYWENKAAPVIGLDGLAGLEYYFSEVPLTIGLEAKPYFNLLGKNFFQLQPFDIAFTFRYIF